MGTWGEGNFDSDDAYEFLDIVIDDLLSTIRTCMTSNRQANHHWFYERYGEARLMPAIDLLISISKHYTLTLESRLSLDTITTWRDTYLRIYDRVIDDYTPKSDYIAKRRKVIEETFGQLLELAKGE